MPCFPRDSELHRGYANAVRVLQHHESPRSGKHSGAIHDAVFPDAYSIRSPATAGPCLYEVKGREHNWCSCRIPDCGSGYRVRQETGYLAVPYLASTWPASHTSMIELAFEAIQNEVQHQALTLIDCYAAKAPRRGPNAS